MYEILGSDVGDVPVRYRALYFEKNHIVCSVLLWQEKVAVVSKLPGFSFAWGFMPVDRLVGVWSPAALLP